MTDSNELPKELEKEEVKTETQPKTSNVESEISNEISEKSVSESSAEVDITKKDKEKVEECELQKETNGVIRSVEPQQTIAEKKPEQSDSMGSFLATEDSKKVADVENVEQRLEKPKEVAEEKVEEKNTSAQAQSQLQTQFQPPSEPALKAENQTKQQLETTLSSGKEEAEKTNVKKAVSLVENYTDSSQSSSSELQSSAAPFESSSSSQEQHFHASRIDFENAIQSSVIWTGKKDPPAVEIMQPTVTENPDTNNASAIPVITLDENTESAPPTEVPPVTDGSITSFVGPGFQPPSSAQQPIVINDQPEITVIKEEPRPVTPIIIQAPRKRGRPRKQVLPNPSPIDESWGPNGQEFSSLVKSGKRSVRAERRQSKKKKFEEDMDENGDDGDDTPKRRYTPKTVRKRKSRGPYGPRKKLPPPRKKQSEFENIQNFEEETRMSASEHSSVFSSRAGAMGDESQGSSVTTEGQQRSNVSKKGRMEVGTDGCKPVTVQQIVEYFWPPQSSLPPSEKPEGLMIQEQITEYLGVKSFKRRYPSIKRRPVDMEERNYLQENGFVSENMCDMGLTAVYSADILEIMYNDFPQKFEEYRKYSREKKIREQRALREKQAAERADMDPKKEAIEAAHSWNTEFNKARLEKRASCFDLQTFTVHFPANRYKQISLGKPGHYPVALIPGQNTDYYKKYTSNELKYFPLNTVLYGPLRPNERHFPLRGGSDGSQSDNEDSSSSDDSSSTSSGETQDTDDSNSTADSTDGIKVEPKLEKPEPEETPKRGGPRTPKGRGRGRVKEPLIGPRKKLGRPPKIKVPEVNLERLDGEDELGFVKGEKIIIHTCKMCHEEESKNKNGEFEAFIQCSQCNGKIHPSCIDLTAEMIPKISSYGWQCTDCKTCVKCEQSSNEDKMIFCDQCDRGYHIYCVGLSEVPSGNYICNVCKPFLVPEAPASLPNGVEKMEIKEETPEIKEEIKTENENPDKCNP